ncbi:MAG: S8 family serine peptidase [Aquihabitans sp.]
MSDHLIISIDPDEVIAPSTIIEVHSDRAIDPQSAQDAITIRGLPVIVELTKRGRVARVNVPDEFPPGRHRLVVRELLDTKGEVLEESLVRPFVVCELPDLPDGVRVEHLVRVRVDEFALTRTPAHSQGERVAHFVKAVSRETGEPMDLAFDEDGNQVDGDELRGAVEKRRLERFGCLEESLARQMERADDQEVVPVTIWAPLPPESTPDLPDKGRDGPTTERPRSESELDDLVKKATTKLTRTLARLEIGEGRAHPRAPMVEADVTVAQLRDLARNDAVGAVFLRDDSAVFDLGDSIAVARSDRAHSLGFDGTGVNVAVWEDGPDVRTNLDIDGRFTNSPAVTDHSRLTHAIIKNTEAGRPHGHAPDCNLFSANTTSTDALRWAIEDQGCTVISQSFHRFVEARNGSLQGDDVLKDWLVLRWPYPTILQAAGNFWSGDDDAVTPPQDEFVNHKGFNSFNLANHDDTAGSIAGGSTFRNPTSSHGDRELPELAANGQGVTAAGVTKSGTSFAAPAAAGVTALLQDVSSTLQSWPEGCRAILLAGADRNIRDSSWWNDVAAGVDTRDGAGAVNAEESVCIAQQGRWRDAPATRRGWDVGTLRSADVGANRQSTFRYHVSTPRYLFSPRVKVALAWDSKVASITLPFVGTLPLSSQLTVDLDLQVFDSRGNLVAHSSSWDNSYEVAEFEARPNSTYDIVIRRWSGTDDVWYGLAWNTTGQMIVWEPISGTFVARHLADGDGGQR